MFYIFVSKIYNRQTKWRLGLLNMAVLTTASREPIRLLEKVLINDVCKNNMAAGAKKKDENNDHILYNLLVHAEWNLDGEVLVRNLIF